MTFKEGFEESNKTEILLEKLSRVCLGIQPHRYAKGKPHEHPDKTDQLEGVGLFISQARGNSNNRLLERDANSLKKEKLNGCSFTEIFVEHMFSGCVEESRDEKCREELEVGRECAFWEMKGVSKKICVACEVLAKNLVPDATVQLLRGLL